MKLSKILSVLALAALAACSPEFKYEVTPADTLELETTTVKFISADAGSRQVEVDANTKWTAAVDTAAKWVSVEKGDGVLTINAEPNPGILVRTAIVTVSAGNRTVDITVSQQGGDVVFGLDKEEIAASGWSAVSDVVNVTANLTWTIVPNADWIIASTFEGDGSAAVTLSAEENVSLSGRTGYAYFYHEKELLGRVIVSQEGVVPTVTFDNANISEGSAAFTRTIKVNSTWAYEVYTSKKDSLWLTVTPPAAGEDGLIARGDGQSVTIAASAGGVARTGTVYFKSVESVFPVTVTQSGGETTLSVNKNSVSFATADAASDKFTVTSNNFWEIKDIPSWITLSQNEGAPGTVEISVDVPKREGAVRSAVLKVVSENKEEQITVSQPAGPITVEVLIHKWSNGYGSSFGALSIPFTVSFPAGYSKAYNLGVLHKTLKDNPEITLDFFSNYGYVDQNTANGIRMTTFFNEEADALDSSKSNAIRDEDFAYVKFPALEGLTLKKVIFWTATGGTENYPIWITSDPFVSNADAASAAKAQSDPTYLCKKNLENSLVLSNPQPNTAYYLMMTGLTIVYCYHNFYLYYE